MRGNIGRRRFLGSAAAGIGAAAMGMAGTARAVGGDEPWDNKVYPTGNAQEDYDNIMAALANPRNRVIFLMSTTYPRGELMAFNLEGQDTIYIERNVTFVGRGAKIIPGDRAVFTCTNKDIKLNLRDIFFKGSKNIPVNVEVGGVPSGINVTQLAIGGDEPWEDPVPPA